MTDYLSIGAIFKDETPYLREWIEYHHLVGVEHFYLLNNADNPREADTVLGPYVRGGLVQHIPYPGVAKQVTGYNFLLEQFGANTYWLAFIDIDEFLFPVATDTVPEVLRDFEAEPIGGVAVNWMVFGSSGLAQRPPVQIETFRYRAPSDFSGGRPPGFFGNRHVKSIVRPAHTLRMKDPHEAEYRSGFTAVNENGRPLPAGYNAPPTYRRLRLNHYILRSRAEFAEKLHRGFACGDGKGTNEMPPERAQLWDDIDSQATVHDDAIGRFLPALSRRLESNIPRNEPNQTRFPARFDPMHVAVCCAYFRESLIEELVADLKDTGVALHLWALDSPLSSLRQWTHGSGLLPKFEVLNWLLAYCHEADLILFLDDDVRLSKDFLPTYLAIVDRLGAAIAMPALTPDSYHTNPITLAQPGCWARLTDYVETGPVVSMRRAFLDQVTPFPTSNPMGWGLEASWWKVAQANHWPMAIVDACPVAHTFRPVHARYSCEAALKDMHRYLVDHQLSWPAMRVLRKFPRWHESREAYLAACPAPVDLLAGEEKASSEYDLPLVGAITGLVRTEQHLVFGPRKAPLARTLLGASGPWHGQVIGVCPAEPAPETDGLPCHFFPQSAEDLFASWSKPVEFLAFDEPAAPAESVRRWLDTWVKGWLKEASVALFPRLAMAEQRSSVVTAIRDWLREQPREWRWQELAGPGSGTGLLWRVGTGPVFEARGFEPGSSSDRPASTREEEYVQSGMDIGPTACSLLPVGPAVVRKSRRASLVIAAHNEGERLCKTIQSCRETLADLDSEILIVDDASTDGSVADLRRRFPDLRVVAHARRRGGPAAKDLGARAARGDVLLFLDGHCKPEPGALTRLVADVEELNGQAIVTPRVPHLDAAIWQNSAAQVGHGFRCELLTLHQQWTGLEPLRPRGRFYESPALIGCCMAMTGDLYDRLWGFDPLMRAWGTEDIDLGLKAWLMGFAVLHDPEVAIGHVFQASFDHYEVPPADALMNHLRLARKNFTESVWHDWLERFRSRHEPALWQEVWSHFQEDRASVERERAYLISHRVHDEFWYAQRFGLGWPVVAPRPGGTDGTWPDPRALFEQHRRYPLNRQALPDAQVVGTVELPEGGQLRLYLKLVRDRSGLVSIQRAAFEAGGCDDAIPYASWLTEHVQGRPFDEVRRLQPADLEQPFMPRVSPKTSANGNGHAPACLTDSGKVGPGRSPAAMVVAALRQAMGKV